MRVPGRSGFGSPAAGLRDGRDGVHEWPGSRLTLAGRRTEKTFPDSNVRYRRGEVAGEGTQVATAGGSMVDSIAPSAAVAMSVKGAWVANLRCDSDTGFL